MSYEYLVGGASQAFPGFFSAVNTTDYTAATTLQTNDYTKALTYNMKVTGTLPNEQTTSRTFDVIV